MLLTREPAIPPLAESLPPSVDKLFDLLGVRPAVEAAGFVRTTGNTVWWGRSEVRHEGFADGATGYQVLQSDLERVLVGLAREAGVDVRPGADVRSVEGWDRSAVGGAPVGGAPVGGAPVGGAPVGGAPVGGPSAEAEGVSGPDATATVQYEEDGALGSIRARWVLDCTGRTGVIAKPGLRRHEEGPSTLALVGVWERPGGWGLDDETHTLVESYQDGWAWSVPVSETARYFTAMVDPRLTDLERGGAVAETYGAELAKTAHLAALLEGARRTAEPWACTATTYDATRFGGRGFLLVGDAGSFIDPLSSFGVKKAMASAWLAAVVVNTALSNPGLTEPAIELFDRRERDIYRAYRRQSARFSEEAGLEHEHGFWNARAAHVDELDPAAFTREPDAASLRVDPAVIAAFEALKESPGIRLRPSASLDTTEEPTIEGNEVVMERRLVFPGWPAGVRHLRGVDLPALVGMAPDFDQVPDLFEAYTGRHDAVALPDFLGALSVLIAKGVLENRFGS